MNSPPPDSAFSLRLSPSPPFRDAGETARAAGLPLALPDQVNGQPARYFWKEVIRCGRYVHPQTGRALDVTPERLDAWLGSFRRMRAAGVKVYVPVNHSRRTEDNRGYVIDARRSGPGMESLELLHQLIGEDACRDAARAEVSLRIVPDLKDGLGNAYGEAIEHASLVVDPVVPGQRGFEPAANPPAGGTAEPLAASRGGSPDETTASPPPPGEPTDNETTEEPPVFILSAHPESPPPPDLGGTGQADAEKGTDMPVTPLQVQAVRELVGDDASAAPPGPLTPANAMDVLISFARKLRADVALSRRPPEASPPAAPPPSPDPDDATLALLSRSLRTERDAAVAAGGITPAVAGELDALLCDAGRPTGIALSRSDPSADPLAFRLYAILRRNRPVEMGQRAGVQALSRAVPPDEAPAGRLPYEDMAARYNRRVAAE